MRMRSLRPAVAAALLAGSAFGCGMGPFRAHETVVETRAFDAGGEFTLENANGRVIVTTWNEPRVRIEAEKAAASGYRLRQLEVEVVGEGGRVSVRTRAPRAWLFGGGGSRVDYRVTLPADARVRVSTLNGSVELEGLTGQVRASTTNGQVEITNAAGDVEASTVNGAINARYRTMDPDGRHRFTTTNGSITVEIPQGAGGLVDARTVNGGVHNELPLESTERSTRRSLEGRLGRGRGSIELRTVNGAIRLRRG